MISKKLVDPTKMIEYSLATTASFHKSPVGALRTVSNEIRKSKTMAARWNLKENCRWWQLLRGSSWQEDMKRNNQYSEQINCREFIGLNNRIMENFSVLTRSSYQLWAIKDLQNHADIVGGSYYFKENTFANRKYLKFTQNVNVELSSRIIVSD